MILEARGASSHSENLAPALFERIHSEVMSEDLRWRRRAFLEGSARLALGLALAGCGSSGGDGGQGLAGSSALSPSLTTLSGRLDLRQIGGQGLKVLSPYFSQGVVGGGGDFQTACSQSGAQMLLVSDLASKLRGMAVNLPGSPLVVDAHSTALAIILWSSHLLTVVPEEVASRLSLIEAQPGFAAFLAYLTSQLATTDLLQISQDPQFQSLRDALTQQVTAALAAIQPRLASTGDIEAQYTGPGGSNTVAKIDFGNFGWRYVSLIRQERNSQGQEVRHQWPTLTGAQNPFPDKAPALLSGANSLSWGNLYTHQVTSEGNASDAYDLSKDSSVTSLTYYVYGLGANLLASQSSPSTFSTQEVERALTESGIATIFYYLLGPMLDSLGGLVPGVAGTTDAVIQALGEVGALAVSMAGSGVNVAGFIASINSGDAGNIKGAKVDALLSFVGALLSILATTELLPALVPVVTFLGTALGLLGATFAIFNEAEFVKSFLTLPAVGKLDVVIPSAATGYRALVLDHNLLIELGVAAGPYGSMTGSVSPKGDVGYSTVLETAVPPSISLTGPPATIASGLYYRRRSDTLSSPVEEVSDPYTIDGGYGPVHFFQVCQVNGNGDILYQDHLLDSQTGYNLYTLKLWKQASNQTVTVAQGSNENLYGSLNDAQTVVYIDGYQVFLWKAGQTTEILLFSLLGISFGSVSNIWINIQDQIIGNLGDNGVAKIFSLTVGDVNQIEVLFSQALAYGLNDSGQILYFTLSDSNLMLWTSPTSTVVATNLTAPDGFSFVGSMGAVFLNNLGEVLIYDGEFKIVSQGTTQPVTNISGLPSTQPLGTPLGFGDGREILVTQDVPGVDHLKETLAILLLPA